MDEIDEDALDDATYKVYETRRKCLNTSLKTVGVSPVNLHGVPQQSCYKRQAEIGQSCRHV